MIRISRVWDGDLSLFSARLDEQPALDEFLTPEESTRAERFHSSHDRRRYVAARGVLRLLLAERTGHSPRSVPLVVGEYGKPFVASHPQLAFNASHSTDTALFTFAPEGEIGVDIEHLRPLDPLALSQTCFSQSERAELAGLPAPRRLDAFFQGWVRKEAVIKADGRGMSMPLDSFSVRLDGPPQLTVPPQKGSWDLREIPVGDDARAALAWKRPDPTRVFISPAVH